MEFSEKVKYVRMKLYLSQTALAKELGVSYATVNRWENQGREPQLAQIGKFNDFCEKKGIHLIIQRKRYNRHYRRHYKLVRDYLQYWNFF